MARHVPGRELAAVQAFLTADQREVRIGREAERRLRIVLEVPLDVGHGGLLVVADDAAQRVGQPLARALHLARKEVRGIQREHEGALVVLHAATDQVAVLARHREGVEMPAQPLGHDVRVRDGRDLHVRLAQ